MGIGVHLFIEVHPSRTGLPIASCITPGGVSLFNNREMFQMLGLKTGRTDIPDPLIACRGWPSGVSREIANITHIFLSDDAPAKRAMKKIARHYSREDEKGWVEWGLKIVEIPAPENYTFTVPDGARCVFDPGCEKVSWLTAAELMRSLKHSGYDIDHPDESDSQMHNACVFRWIRDLSSIYGEEELRVVFWFDSVGREYL